MTNDEWTDQVADLMEAYGSEVSARWAALWFPAVEPFAAETISEAVAQHMTGPRAQWMPNGGGLAAIAGELIDDRPSFEAVWAEINRKIARVGYDSQPELSPAAARIVAAIGWRNICLGDSDDLGTLRAQARRMLEDVQRSDRLEPARRRLGVGGRRVELVQAGPLGVLTNGAAP